MNTRGYRRINVDGVSVAAHRAAWALKTGAWPAMDIDHEDGVGDHNWWINLRLATDEQNQANARLKKTNTSGFKGVSRVRSGRWQANIWYKKRSIYLGRFDTPEEAHAAYLKSARLLRDPLFVRAA